MVIAVVIAVVVVVVVVIVVVITVVESTVFPFVLLPLTDCVEVDVGG